MPVMDDITWARITPRWLGDQVAIGEECRRPGTKGADSRGMIGESCPILAHGLLLFMWDLPSMCLRMEVYR